MKRHNLYEINLERQTAFCTVCGYTEIYVANARTRKKPKVICINRARELSLDSKVKRNAIREEKHSQPDWQPRHFLSEIDGDLLVAVCTICGPTDIRKVIFKGYTRYTCATKQREYMREYRRSHYIARSTNPHALSDIDEEKQTAVCAKCGPVEIEIWLGERKINRRCINAKNEWNQAQVKPKKQSLGKIEA